MRFRVLAPLFIALLALTSCSTKKTVLPYFVDIQDQQGTLPAIEYMSTIQPDDELQITVTAADAAAAAAFNQPEVNPALRSTFGTGTTPKQLTYRVDTSGNILFPQLGTIHVAGLTVEQLQQELTSRLQAYIVDPQVTVSLVNFTVVVAGEVRTPQTVKVNRNRFTILEALSAAGDLTEYGERSNVLIIREENGQRTYAHVDLNSSDLLTSPYYYLQQNDYIYVSPNKIKQANSKYNTNNSYKLSVTSTIVSACSVIASLIIALAVK